MQKAFNEVVLCDARLAWIPSRRACRRIQRAVGLGLWLAGLVIWLSGLAPLAFLTGGA